MPMPEILVTLDGNAQTLSGALTFYDLRRPSSGYQFLPCREHGDHHKHVCQAQAATTPLKLRSTTAATQWKIDPRNAHLELCRCPRQLEHECHGYRPVPVATARTPAINTN